MKLLGLVWVCVVVGSGCGSNDAGPNSDPNQVSLSGAVFDFAGLAPLEGVQICIFEDSSIPCAMSDENGRYAVRANKNTDVIVEYELAGYMTKLRHIRLAAEDRDLSIFNMESDARVTELLGQAGVTRVPGTCIAAVQVSGQRDGATATLVPGGGDGPFYTTTNEDIDPQLTGTTADGLGVAVFVNVPPGDYSMVVALDGFECTTSQTPGTEAHSAAAHCIADVIAENSIRCQ